MNANFSCAPLLPRATIFRFVCIGGLALATISPARTQKPDFAYVATQMAHAVEDAKASNVVVFDFVGPDTKFSGLGPELTGQVSPSRTIFKPEVPGPAAFISELGRSLADEFSARIAAAGGKFQVVDRAKLKQAIESNRFAPEIVAEAEMAVWLADSVGAMSAIAARLALSGNSLQITFDCFRVKDGTITGSFRVSYPFTDEWKTLSEKNIDPDASVTSMDTVVKLPESQVPTAVE